MRQILQSTFIQNSDPLLGSFLCKPTQKHYQLSLLHEILLHGHTKVCLLVLVHWFVALHAHGQTDSSHNGIPTSPRSNKEKSTWLIKWTPSSLATPETPSMQFGLEFMPKSNHLGIEFDFSVKCIPGKDDWDGRFDMRYNKSRIELRYYLHSFRERKNKFLCRARGISYQLQVFNNKLFLRSF